jgi:hypothetical protein
MQITYYSSTETAKIIRQELKMIFPTVKFSVRKTGHNSIAVSFTGTKLLGEAVNKLVSKYRGGYFDGMTDSMNYITHMVNDKPVSYGADFIFVYLTDVDAA